jgi:tripartite ATP-independent transporter DctM subunit
MNVTPSTQDDSPLSRIAAPLAWLAENMAVVAMFADLIVTFVNTVGRYLFHTGLEWSEDLSSIAMPIITFIGGAAYFRRGWGMAYTAVVDRTRGLMHETLVALGLWMSIALSAGILSAMPDFLRGQSMQTLPVLDISLTGVSIWMGIGFALFILFALEKLLRLSGRAQMLGFGCAAVLAGYILMLRIASDAGTLPVDPLAALLVILIIGFICAVPMALVLAIGGLSFFIVTNSAPVVAAPAIIQAGIGSFLLVAIPFFLLAGVLMEITGMARRLIDMIQDWVGHWRGGLLLAEVVSMYVFSGMSGSKAADVAAVGNVMKGPLRERGYPPTESVAVLAASAAMGEVIPPSVALLILGSATTLSVGSLFIAGIAPAALLAFTLMIGILIRSYRYGFPKGPPFNLVRALRSIPPALPALLVPLIVLGGIIGGIASATESSSFAVVYGLLAAILVYRSLDAKSAWTGFREAAVTSGMVLLMLSTANLLSQAIVIDGLGAKLSVLLDGLTDARVFLFVSMAAIIVLGFVLEGFPAILITAPLLLPIAQKHGIDPLHYGILLTMSVGIGVFMPPVGIGYYIACAVGEASPHETIRPSLIYNIFLIIGLIVCILYPEIILTLPRMVGL